MAYEGIAGLWVSCDEELKAAAAAAALHLSPCLAVAKPSLEVPW